MAVTERPSGPLYRWVADDIAGKVSSGKLCAGDRLPSEHALCELYSVSQITVRRALRELRHDGMVVSRHGLGWFVSEHPKANSYMATVSVIVPDQLERLPYGLLQILLRALRDARFRVVVAVLGGDPDGVQDALYAAAAQRHVAAILFVQGESTRLSERYVSVVQDSPLPVIMAPREIDGLDVGTVVLDEDMCAAAVTSHLIAMGHRRIAYVGADPTDVDGDRRYWGFANTLWDHHAEVSLEWVITGKLGSPTLTHRLENLFSDSGGPTAVFCSHDAFALQAISTVSNVGRACPRDVAVVGMGDEPICGAASTPITSVRFDLDGLSSAVISQLKGLMLGEDVAAVHVGGRIIKRRSCGSSLPPRIIR